jgi:hypothetical protein
MPRNGHKKDLQASSAYYIGAAADDFRIVFAGFLAV